MAGSDKLAKAAQRQRRRLQQFLQAGRRHLRDEEVFTLCNVTKTWGQWQKVFAQMLQPYEQRDQVLAELKVKAGQLQQTIRQNTRTNGPYLVAFGMGMEGRFGKSHPVLKQFGLITKQPKKPDTKTRAAAVISRRNTRLARHTMGKRQKAKIKGGKATVTLVGPDGKPLRPRQ